jgi:succinate dehydrogenase / fumarate reductase membrane anchor subunit
MQRFSAVVLAAYSFFILGSFIMYPDMDFQQWYTLFESGVMRVFSLISLVALCAHGWIGMWTVATDYMTPLQFGKAATPVRLLFQAGCFLLICVYLIWGIQILWGF